MNARILVIEDDRFLRKACEVGLTKRGFTITTATNGEDGLRCAEAELPDLILLDMRMPRLTGMEALAALKKNEKTRPIPVAILSNSFCDTTIQEAKSLGVVGYLVKSDISLRELGDRVTGFLS